MCPLEHYVLHHQLSRFLIPTLLEQAKDQTKFMDSARHMYAGFVFDNFRL